MPPISQTFNGEDLGCATLVLNMATAAPEIVERIET
jgi:hypothetical protein